MSIWLDNASGNIGFSYSDTFFIVPNSEVPSLFSTKLKEQPSMFNDTKWKPKELTLDIDNEKFTIMDPYYKKNNIFTGEFSLDELKSYFPKIVSCGFFNVSLIDYTKKEKQYKRELKKWIDFCIKFDLDYKELSRKYAPLHFRLKPIEV